MKRTDSGNYSFFQNHQDQMIPFSNHTNITTNTEPNFYTNPYKNYQNTIENNFEPYQYDINYTDSNKNVKKNNFQPHKYDINNFDIYYTDSNRNVKANNYSINSRDSNNKTAILKPEYQSIVLGNNKLKNVTFSEPIQKENTKISVSTPIRKNVKVYNYREPIKEENTKIYYKNENNLSNDNIEKILKKVIRNNNEKNFNKKLNAEDMENLRTTMKGVLTENKNNIELLKKNNSNCNGCNWRIKENEDLKFSLQKKKDENFDLKMKINKYKKILLNGNDFNNSVLTYNGDRRILDELKYDLKRNKECYDHEINHFKQILKDKNEQLGKVLKERRPYDIMNDETNRNFWKNH